MYLFYRGFFFLSEQSSQHSRQGTTRKGWNEVYLHTKAAAATAAAARPALNLRGKKLMRVVCLCVCVSVIISLVWFPDAVLQVERWRRSRIWHWSDGVTTRGPGPRQCTRLSWCQWMRGYEMDRRVCGGEKEHLEWPRSHSFLSAAVYRCIQLLGPLSSATCVFFDFTISFLNAAAPSDSVRVVWPCYDEKVLLGNTGWPDMTRP